VNKAAEKNLADFIARFASTEAELVSYIVTQLANGNMGRLRDRRRAARHVRAALVAFQRRSLPGVPGVVKSGYLSGRQRSKAPQRGLNSKDRESIEILVDNLEGRLKDTVTVVGRRVDDIFRKEGLRAASIAIASKGDENLAIRNAIKNLNKKGVTAFVDTSGRQWGLETYARMATRATMQEAESYGAYNLIVEQGFDLVMIDYPSRLEFDPDSACAPHHKKIYSATGRTKGFPTLKELPPYHNECKHFIRLAPGAAEERRRAA
jgi:hypothetical protein